MSSNRTNNNTCNIQPTSTNINQPPTINQPSTNHQPTINPSHPSDPPLLLMDGIHGLDEESCTVGTLRLHGIWAHVPTGGGRGLRSA